MKLWIIPLLAVGAFAGSTGNEPSEVQLRAAFEESLALQVRNAIDFAQESGGPEAVATIRANGTDRFEIKDFRKLGCSPERDGAAYRCEFSVEIGLVTGPMRQTLTGRFERGMQGLVFASSV